MVPTHCRNDEKEEKPVFTITDGCLRKHRSVGDHVKAPQLTQDQDGGGSLKVVYKSLKEILWHF